MSNKFSKQIGNSFILVTRKFRNNAGLAWRVHLKSEVFNIIHFRLLPFIIGETISLLPLVGVGERRARCARGVPSQSKRSRISSAINSKTLSVSKNVDGKSDRVYQFKKNIVSAKRTIVTDLHFAILLFLLILISLHIFLLLIFISLVISLSSQLSLLFSPSISLSLSSPHSLFSTLTLFTTLSSILSR